MYDDVPARLLQPIYRALDAGHEWREILHKITLEFDARAGSMGIVEAHDHQHQTYTSLADTGIDGHSYPRPGSLLGALSCDDAAPSGGRLPTVLETRHHSDWDLYEVHVGGRLRDRAIVLLELRRKAGFEDDEQRQLLGVIEHLARVVRTRRDLRRIRLVEEESAAALNVLGVPAAIVDADCVVLAKNQLFDQMLERDTLRLSYGNRVEATRRALTERLRDNVCELVEDAASPTNGAVDSDLSVVLDARPHHQATIVASPVQRGDEADPHVLLSVYHPDADHCIDDDLLETLYDFTPTEAQTAARLAEGYTIDEIADYRRCAKSTVRTHVKRILQKTGTHRQAELVRVILGSPAATLTAWGA